MLIIGITGTIGAGKGTISDYLVNEKGFKHFSVREFLTKEIEKRKMPVNRDSMVVVANDLRKNNGSDYIVKSLYAEAKKTGDNCIIESLRAPLEVEALQKLDNFYLFAVDADPKIRYERNVKRRSETDNITFEKFLTDEKLEMTSSDPAKQNLGKCIEMADYKFENNEDIENLCKQVNNVLNKLTK